MRSAARARARRSTACSAAPIAARTRTRSSPPCRTRARCAQAAGGLAAAERSAAAMAQPGAARQRPGVAAGRLRPNQAVGTLVPGQNNSAAREGYRAAERIAVLLPTADRSRRWRRRFATASSPPISATRIRSVRKCACTIPANAAEAVDATKAVAEGAEHVVGPLRRDAVSAVFAQGHLPVPVLTLNQPEHGEVPPPGSAAFGLTPDTEAAQAAEHMLERGIKSAAIITASDDWAERAALAFRASSRTTMARYSATSAYTKARSTSPRDPQATAACTRRRTRRRYPGPRRAPRSNDAHGCRHIHQHAPAAGAPAVAAARGRRFNGVPVFATSHIFPAIPNRVRTAIWTAWNSATRHGCSMRSSGCRDTARSPAARLRARRRRAPVRDGLDAYGLVPYLDWLAQHHDGYLPGATGQLTDDELGRVQRC